MQLTINASLHLFEVSISKYSDAVFFLYIQNMFFHEECFNAGKQKKNIGNVIR